MSYKLTTLNINIDFLLNAPINLLRNKKKALYYGWLGFKNLGDEVLYHCINELFKNHLKMITSRDYERLLFKEALTHYFDVLILGGGTLVNRNDTIINTIRNYKKFIRRSIVFGTGVANEVFWKQYERRTNHDAEWKSFLSECDFVGVRGPVSLEYMKGLGIKKAVITGDPVLYLGRDRVVSKSVKKRVGINFGYTNNKLWGDSDKAVEDTMHGFIKMLLAEGCDISFLNVYEKDMAHWHHFEDHYGLQGKIRFFDGSNCTIEKALEYFSDIDVFVGEKLHASVLAACTYTPFIMLEYRPKCFDFMSSIGCEQYNFRVDRVSPENLMDSVHSLFDNNSVVQQMLYERVKAYKEVLKQSAYNAINAIG